MRKIQFSPAHAKPIKLFESISASEVVIGQHQSGFDQLFLVAHGVGWAIGGDGRRVELSAGQGVYLKRGELHSKGSDTGMTAIMVQVTNIEPNESTMQL